MATYINLLNWTDQGIKNFRQTLQRAEDAEKMAKELGVAFEHIYWTQGPYDVVVVTDAPDDETETAFMLKVDALGSIRSTTLRAFDKVEMREIINKAG